MKAGNLKLNVCYVMITFEAAEYGSVPHYLQQLCQP